MDFALRAAEEARAHTVANPPLEPEPTGFAAAIANIDKQQGKERTRKRLSGVDLIEEAERVARIAYLGAMPRLTKRSNAQASIACIAVGVQQRYITGVEARTMLYTAQLALGAFPKRSPSKGRKAK